MNVAGCLACDVLSGRVEVPGGTIAETEHWHADHCLGPFGVGAVVVKSKEHVKAQRGWDVDRERWAAGPPPAEEAAEAAERLRAFLRKP